MKALGHTKAGPIDAPDALVEIDAPRPEVGPHDLLVEVKGVSINPVDVKVRESMPPAGDHRILGYDAAGVVVEVGDEVTRFAVGDEVFYAGDITRPGTDAELHAVDERIVGRKPASLDFPDAAGLPLTSITAWEILFDCFRVEEGAGKGETLLVIGGAGGVGSILIQLAKALTGLTVIATASRSETSDWVRKMGADHVVNHHEPLAEQVKALGLVPRYVASLSGSEQHFPAIVELIEPRGHIAIIDDPENIDIGTIKMKALTFSFEFMFARSMFATDMAAQHELLTRVSGLLDDGAIVSTVTDTLGALGVDTLRHAHELQESGRVIGKHVLRGF